MPDWCVVFSNLQSKRQKRYVSSNTVSFTSVSWKTVEHVIFHLVMNHYDQHNNLAHHQHIFRKTKSRETQLMNRMEDNRYHSKIKTNKRNDLLILDFYKGFYIKRLLPKMEQSGIPDTNQTTSQTKSTCWERNSPKNYKVDLNTLQKDLDPVISRSV